MASSDASSGDNPQPDPTPQRPAAPPVLAPLAPELPPRVVVEMAPQRWQRLTTRIAWAGFIICGLLLLAQSAALSDYFNTTEGVQEKFHSGALTARDKIAIIDVSGVIMDGDGYVKKQIDRVRADDAVRAVVLRVDSPGGTVTGSDYILHHLNKLREDKKIPLVVSMGSLAASGGYYVSMAVGDQERSIFAEPTTTTGSIGVVIPHYDISGLMERFDVKDDSIASHPRKLMLSITRPMSEDDRQLAQQYVEHSLERFLMIIKQGRPAFRDSEGLMHEGKNLATGEIFTADLAKEYGLVDEIGFLEEAIARAAELAGLDASKLRVVRYQSTGLSLNELLAVRTSRSQNSEWAALLEQAVPRAYYLCTTLPVWMKQ